MSQPLPKPSLNKRVTDAILDGAARSFAIHGEQASMADVAVAAGVARATVYRYFPNREALVDALTRATVSDLEARLDAARIDEVVPEEGIGRAVRALVDLGDPFVLLARERLQSDAERFERSLAEPLRRLFERGQADGVIRDDVASARLTEALIGLIVGVLTSRPPLGKEDSNAVINRLFLEGARGRGPRPG